MSGQNISYYLRHYFTFAVLNIHFGEMIDGCRKNSVYSEMPPANNALIREKTSQT